MFGKKKVHWHFLVIGYTEKDKNKNNILKNSTEIMISSVNTEEEAVAVAKEKVKRPNYFLRSAWQCLGNCQKRLANV